MIDYDIFPLGDQAVCLSFGNVIDQRVHRRILAAREWILANHFPGLTDVVIGYSSMTLTYDAFVLAEKITRASPATNVTKILRDAIEQAIPAERSRVLKRIPVCYELEFAPDMGEVAAWSKLSAAEIAALHHSRRYEVYMIGFLPGFPYLAHVDERIRVPRKNRPSAGVEAGSVAIAGEQTGIYPVESPGGWMVIGRTPVTLFNKNAAEPALLEPGHEVEFYPVSAEEFHRIRATQQWD